MDGKLAQLTLAVTDQAKALAFYTERAGFEKKTDVTPPGRPRWVTVGLKGQELEIALYEVGSAVDPEQQARAKDWRPGRTPPLVIRVADVRRVFQELSTRGVHFPQPPKEYPWGVAATFADPDGNLFSLSQPAWSRAPPA